MWWEIFRFFTSVPKGIYSSTVLNETWTVRSTSALPFQHSHIRVTLG
jgi:hypothetical protein